MNSSLQIKVCGNKFPGNTSDVANLDIEMMGFIFFKESKRNVSSEVGEIASDLKKEIKKVGVFVNESISKIKEIHRAFDLNYVQLHGDETEVYCREFSGKVDLDIIKVFRVGASFDFDETNKFENVASYFLFDTKTELYGGSGKKFDWKKLKEYSGKTSFFLSGGIGPGDIVSINKIQHPKFVGIDLNSGFENKPGQKDIEKLTEFINKIKN